MHLSISLPEELMDGFIKKLGSLLQPESLGFLIADQNNGVSLGTQMSKKLQWVEGDWHRISNFGFAKQVQEKKKKKKTTIIHSHDGFLKERVLLLKNKKTKQNKIGYNLTTLILFFHILKACLQISMLKPPNLD